MHEEGGEKVVPYLARKSTEEPSDVLEQGVDGLAGERNSEQNGLDGPDGESEIRGGEKSRRGVRRRVAARSGLTVGAAAVVVKQVKRMWLVDKPYSAV